MAVDLLVRGSITVPNDYIGVHSNWPGAGVDPATLGISIGHVRLLDGSSPWMWRHIETSQGVYSWGGLDTKITEYRSRGWTVTFQLYGTPFFYASTVDQGFNDQYNLAGGAAYPAQDVNLAGLSAFVTALVTRYNSPSGAWRVANPSLGKGIQVFETWNEPNFYQNYSGYWWGTASQLVDVCHVVYTAVKAVDAQVVVTTPAFFGESHCWPWIQASGSLFPSVKAVNTFDAFDLHGYLSMPCGAPYAGLPYDIAWGSYGVYPFINFANRYKPGAEIHVSEYGFDTKSTSQSLQSLLAEPPAIRKKILARVMATAAAMGVKRFAVYLLSSTLAGNYTTDTDGVVSAINLVSQICGKTIVAATAEIGGPVTLKFSDGSTWTV